MRLEEIYYHYSNLEYQLRQPRQLQDKRIIKQSEIAIKQITKHESKNNSKDSSKQV
jgi:hypothetical protein